MVYQLTRNFSSSEMKCKCCGVVEMDIPFLTKLQELRDKIKRPMYITSGFRCVRHNSAVGGSPRSFHTMGRAVDVSCKTADERHELVGAAISDGWGGIGIAESYVHLDDRVGKPRKIWLYKK